MKKNFYCAASNLRSWRFERAPYHSASRVRANQLQLRQGDSSFATDLAFLHRQAKISEHDLPTSLT